MHMFNMVTLIGFLSYIVSSILKFFKRCCFSSNSAASSAPVKNVTPGGQQDGPLILTPLIDHGNFAKAKNLSEVNPSLFAGVKSHAAYITVDKIRKWNLFFWYFPAQDVNLESTPLIIWLQGGPGVSSLYGLFGEIGPLQIIDGSVQKMPITWASNYSLLFIDNPVGTGFSYSNGAEYVTNQDAVGRCLLSFIQQFLRVFPELRRAPLFLAGESYAGKYLPAFGHYIHHYNNNDLNPINLRGLAICSGWIDPPSMLHNSEWALQVGLIDHKEATEISKLESKARRYWKQKKIHSYVMYAVKAFTRVVCKAPVNIYNYTDGESHGFTVYGEANNFTGPADTAIETFLNKTEVQNALHVKKQKFAMENQTVLDWLGYDIFLTAKPWLEELMEHYGVLCFNGQLDMAVPYSLAVRTYNSLKWSGRQGYLNNDRQCLYDEENGSQINSFIKSSIFFMEAMVVGAGHMVPADKPRAAKQIIDKFINRYK